MLATYIIKLKVESASYVKVDLWFLLQPNTWAMYYSCIYLHLQCRTIFRNQCDEKPIPMHSCKEVPYLHKAWIWSCRPPMRIKQTLPLCNGFVDRHTSMGISLSMIPILYASTLDCASSMMPVSPFQWIVNGENRGLSVSPSILRIRELTGGCPNSSIWS